MAVKDFKLTNNQDTDMFGGGAMDVTYNNQGDVEMIDGVYYLNQEVQKDLLTQKREDNLYEEYGSYVRNLVGDAVEDTIFRSFVIYVINETLSRLSEQQGLAQNDYDFDSSQLFDSIQNISVERIDNSPTQYTVTVYVTTKSGEVLPISFPFSGS